MSTDALKVALMWQPHVADDWEFDSMKVEPNTDADEDDPNPEPELVYVPEVSYLGHTAIVLGHDGEGSGRDCRFVSAACQFVYNNADKLRELMEQGAFDD